MTTNSGRLGVLAVAGRRRRFHDRLSGRCAAVAAREIMNEKKLVIKSIVITSVFTLVVVGFVPLVLLYLYPPGSAFGLGIHSFAGIVAFVLGAIVSLACVKDFVFKGRGTPAPFDPPKTLVVNGFYRYVRNPMYWGLFLVVVGEALFCASVALFVYLLALAAALNIFVRLYEEPSLSRRFGKAYEAYCAGVNRWIPKFGKRNPPPLTCHNVLISCGLNGGMFDPSAKI